MAGSGNALAKSCDYSVLEIITAVSTPSEARALPRGAVVGDAHGGVTFSDAVAIILEQRSVYGWHDIDYHAESWTVIELNR